MLAWIYLIAISLLLIAAILIGVYIMVDGHKKKKEKYKNGVIQGLIFISISFVGFSLLMPIIMPDLLKIVGNEISHYNELGDAVGGLMNPFIAIAAVIVTGLAFYMQYEANLMQVKQFNKSINLQIELEKKAIVDEKIDVFNLMTINNLELLNNLNETIKWAEGKQKEYIIENDYPDKVDLLAINSMENLLSISYDKLLSTIQWIFREEGIDIKKFIDYHNSLRSLKKLLTFFNSTFQTFLLEDKNIRNELFSKTENLFSELEIYVNNTPNFQSIYLEVKKGTLYSSILKNDLIKRRRFAERLKDKDLGKVNNVLIFNLLNCYHKYDANLGNIIGILETLKKEFPTERKNVEVFDEALKAIKIDSYIVTLSNQSDLDA